MKLMEPTKIISLLPGDEEACRYVPAALLHSVPGITQEWLRDGVRAGKYKVTKVLLDGREAYELFWHKNLQDMLVINCAVALTKRDEFKTLIKAGRQLSRQERCRGIEFITKRRGLVEKLISNGGEITGVTCYLE